MMNDKQTTDESYMSTFLSRKPFFQHINCRIHRTIHEISQIFRRGFLGLSASAIRPQRKCLVL